MIEETQRSRCLEVESKTVSKNIYTVGVPLSARTTFGFRPSSQNTRTGGIQVFDMMNRLFLLVALPLICSAEMVPRTMSMSKMEPSSATQVQNQVLIL